MNSANLPTMTLLKWSRSHTHRGNHPEVVEIIQNVHQSKNRKLKHLESGGESRQDETKQIKKEEHNTKQT
jgi:hypothetical protein